MRGDYSLLSYIVWGHVHGEKVLSNVGIVLPIALNLNQRHFLCHMLKTIHMKVSSLQLHCERLTRNLERLMEN